jgi:hypothetical protein
MKERKYVHRQGERLSWSDLLRDAVREPGRILAAYRAFSEYSVGNQLAAYAQCAGRGLALGPLGTYRQWQERGRQVRHGEKALWLCVPRTVRARAPPEDKDGVEEVPGEERSFMVFSWQPRWFVLGQTEGADFVLPEVSSWDRDTALGVLDVRLVPFAHLDGNVQGYAQGRSVALNPLAALPVKTLFHELGHVLLHTGESDPDGKVLPRSLREVEAEAVALLCVEALGLDGAEFCRGYVQHWLAGGGEIPERSARRIMAAADSIIRAGRRGATGSSERMAA